MTKAEKRAYIKNNSDLSVKEISENLNTTTREVAKLARELGIVLEGQRVYSDRRYCNPPFSCGECPYPDCINSEPATKYETRYVSDALGLSANGKKRKEIVAV